MNEEKFQDQTNCHQRNKKKPYEHIKVGIQ
jgi:hypothetical protein